MKLPDEIKSKNRLRDLRICMDYINGHTPQEIKAKRNFPITLRRINQILYDSSAFLNPRVAWPKSKRIHKRQKLIDNTEQKSKKDIVDQLNDLTREIEGDKSLVSIQEKIVIIRYEEKEKNIAVNSTEIPRRFSVLS